MKKWLKGTLAIIGLVGAFSFVLTGCQTKAPFTNDSDQILYNGGIISVVGDNLVFSNGYKSDEITTIDTYKDFASSTYLSYTKAGDINDKYTSPDVKKIKGEVTGFSNMYSFVYGNNVYYASPSKHKTSSNKYLFNYVSFFKCGFGGNGTQEVFTTKQYDSAKAVVRALKNGNNAYWFIFDGTDLNIVNLNNSKSKTIEDVTSVAIPREGENWNGMIYYTKNKENSIVPGNEAFEYNPANNESTPLGNLGGYTTTFVGRSEDEVFYTLANAETSVTKTYLAAAEDLTDKTITTAGKVFYNGTISNVYSIGNNGMDKYEGYVFSSSLSGNPQIFYYSIQENKSSLVLSNSEYTNMLFTYGDLVYYSNSDGISYKSVSTSATTQVVSGMTIIANKIGYDYYADGSLKNIYFYAQRVYDPDDETAQEDRDQNYYLYTKDAMLDEDALIVGKTVK